MNRRVAVFLAVAAALVTIENVVYLDTSSPPPVDPGEPLADADAAAAGPGAPEGLAVVCSDALTAFLASLPDLQRARIAFLTRDEALTLAASHDTADAVGEPALRLEGTLVNPQRRVAWLAGTVTSEGAFVGDAEVIRIEPGSIVMKRGAEEIRIDLREPALEDPES